MHLLFHSFINSYLVIVLFCFFQRSGKHHASFFIIIIFLFFGKKAENFTLTFTHKSKGLLLLLLLLVALLISFLRYDVCRFHSKRSFPFLRWRKNQALEICLTL